MKRFTFHHIVYILPCLFMLFCTSCGGRAEGHGVLRWSPQEETIRSGSVVPIYEKSTINDTYTVGIPETKKRMKLPMWRINYFKRKKDALSAADEYGRWAKTIGIVKKDGLPIREEPTSDSLRLYKLKLNQEIKILERLEPPATEGEYTDYWYKVLTDDGTIGYCFGHSLEITEIGAEYTQEQNKDKTTRIEKILSVAWRPQYYRKMIDEDRIDLDRFTQDYGLFPTPEKNKLRLVNENRDITFSYTGISESARNTYTFEGTTLLIKVISESKIEITYRLQDTKFMQTFVDLETDVSEVIHKEEMRRKKTYSVLTEKGDTFSSSAYGTITFEKERAFTWDNYKKLVPQIIPPEAGNDGTISFLLFLAEELKQKYDGAVSFHFNGLPPEELTHFLFERDNGGVKFYYVPSEDIEEKTIMRENPFPIVIFFNVRG